MTPDRLTDLDLTGDPACSVLTGDVAAPVRAGIRALVAGELTTGRGFVVIRCPEDLTLADAKKLLLTLSGVLGAVMPQDYQGEQVREVRDRGSDITTSRSARYSDTRFGGHLHTDGMHRPGHIPDFFTLFCHRAAVRGGDSVFVHIDDVVERLSAHAGVIDVLTQDFFFDSRDTSGIGPRTVRRPVLERGEKSMRINYIRQYIDSGHAEPGIPPLTEEQVRALDTVDAVLADTTLHRHARLYQGDLMVIDNRRMVHGRTDFVDSSDLDKRRLLLRTWIDAR
jgi:alpha-ketoglutarate-dependent taurine dioxygenase